MGHKKPRYTYIQCLSQSDIRIGDIVYSMGDDAYIPITSIDYNSDGSILNIHSITSECGHLMDNLIWVCRAEEDYESIFQKGLLQSGTDYLDTHMLKKV